MITWIGQSNNDKLSLTDKSCEGKPIGMTELTMFKPEMMSGAIACFSHVHIPPESKHGCLAVFGHS